MKVPAHSHQTFKEGHWSTEPDTGCAVAPWLSPKQAGQEDPQETLKQVTGRYRATRAIVPGLLTNPRRVTASLRAQPLHL